MGKESEQNLPPRGPGNAAALPSWEIWSLTDAPETLTKKSNKLIYKEKFRRRCICCGGKKRPGSKTTLDAEQAYEQTLLRNAICDLLFVATWAWVVTNERNILIFPEHLALCRMGGSLSTLLDFRPAVVCVSIVETCLPVHLHHTRLRPHPSR